MLGSEFLDLIMEGAGNILARPVGGDERWKDRLKEWFLEHAPRRTAAALRFALGVLEA
jgi:hypothetical protein